MGPTGYNRSWVPFLEQDWPKAEANPKMKFTTNYSGLADPQSLADAPKPGLPTGYTERQYGDELNQFAAGGKTPGFAESDTSGFPEIGSRFRSEMQARTSGRPPSIRALAKQGGY
jgi:hypothetical protein